MWGIGDRFLMWEIGDHFLGDSKPIHKKLFNILKEM